MAEFICKDIYLLKDEHEYRLKSDPEFRFTSCTTFIKQFFTPFDADAVAEKLVNTVPKYRGTPSMNSKPNGKHLQIMAQKFTKSWRTTY